LVAMIGVKFYSPIAWTWYVLIGTVITYVVGSVVSLFFSDSRVPLVTS
jgi:CBS-domain-containing membrane protein